MKLIIRLLAAALATGAVNCQTTPSATSLVGLMTTLSPSEATALVSSSQSDCPTVTLTSNICHTCATPNCVQIKPITKSCGCPSAVPTVFADYPCESGCGDIGCAADYVFFTANCTVPTSSMSPDSPTNTTLVASAALWTGMGLNGTNTTTSRTTITGTSTSLVSAAPSIAAARRMRPFWAVWL
ncbi:hypothetical protein VMCG_03784 [Cytospora schulzeri]|uniref:Extracellular membrane protein CFEM domain-containing protein n=1 Tax=Cytospora schulzeri TaxID=448051 RepID=A0A423WV13_9PEZI|nr:hypothetical protein VMCG_03784 [Valsa malicola]